LFPEAPKKKKKRGADTCSYRKGERGGDWASSLKVGARGRTDLKEDSQEVKEKKRIDGQKKASREKDTGCARPALAGQRHASARQRKGGGPLNHLEEGETAVNGTGGE